MGVEEVGSRCSLKKPLKFRWFGNPDVPEGQDLAAAISKFEEILEAPNLVQNEYLAILATVEFEKKLKSALLGALYPVTEIDRVGKRHGCPLYEIRWQWIPIYRARREHQGWSDKGPHVSLGTFGGPRPFCRASRA